MTDPTPPTPVVLFLCIHNSGRSLAAKVLLDHYAAGRVEVRSSGSDPAGLPIDQVRPIVGDIDRRVQRLLGELTAAPAER
jgi:hypothetical protein